MRKSDLAYEETGVKIWTTDQPGFYLREYTDEARDPQGQGAITIPGKGVCNARITTECMAQLERSDVATHIQDTAGDALILVQRLRILPVKVRVSNIIAGDLAARLDAPVGRILPKPLVEFTVNADALNNPNYNYSHVGVDRDVTEGQVKVLQAMSLEINERLKSFFDERGLALVDCSLEYGHDDTKKIRLGGDITPDTCRLWDRESHEKLDRDLFRRDLRGDELAYRTVLRRVAGES